MKKHEEEIPEFLEELKGEQPFHVPPTYFRSLQQDVMARIGQEDAKPRTAFFPTAFMAERWFRPVLALCACALIIAMVWINQSPEPAEVAINENFSQEEIEQYLLVYLDDIDETYLYQEDLSGMDWIEETADLDESDKIWEGLLDELDEETLQEIF